MKCTTFAVDISKAVFQVALSRRPGVVAEQHRLSRAGFVKFFARQQPAVVLMEACGSAHHWGRELQKMGHEVRLLPPHRVRGYRDRNKHDRADTEALLEASRNARILPVPVKTVEQQALTSLHCLRSAWMATRTARINTVRGLLREFGLAIPLGAENVLPEVEALCDDSDERLPAALWPALREAAEEIRQLEERIATVEHQIEALARQTPGVDRLQSVPGIGLLTSTALVAMVGDARRFPSGRRFASSLGLTPRESSTGLRRRLGAISKRGDPYLRMLLIHGARAVLHGAKRHRKPDRLRAWALRVEKSRGHNKAAVALANKMARIAWAVWSRDETYRAVSAA